MRGLSYRRFTEGCERLLSKGLLLKGKNAWRLSKGLLSKGLLSKGLR
jgi:hypothetical protein